MKSEMQKFAKKSRPASSYAAKKDSAMLQARGAVIDNRYREHKPSTKEMEQIPIRHRLEETPESVYRDP